MTETTTEQLAEIDRDMAEIDRQVAELVEEAQQADYKTQKLPEYTPPEGWRVLQVGERLRDGDVTVCRDGSQYPADRLGGWVGSNQRYIRPIEAEPQPESDAELQAQVAFLKGREVTLATRLQQEREVTTRLRGELESVHNLLGTEKQRVTQLEELVGSLRTINETQEKAFEAAGKENTALRAQVRILQREASKKASRIEFLETLNAGNGAAITDYIAKVAKLQGLVDTARGQLEAAATEHDSLSTQLAAVKAELVTQAETSRQLQIELDAAQQVPQAIADRFEEGWNQGTARAVETVLEWLEPIRLADSAYLANATMQHLPSIMRHLTGLAQD